MKKEHEHEDGEEVSAHSVRIHFLGAGEMEGSTLKGAHWLCGGPGCTSQHSHRVAHNCLQLKFLGV